MSFIHSLRCPSGSVSANHDRSMYVAASHILIAEDSSCIYVLHVAPARNGELGSSYGCDTHSRLSQFAGISRHAIPRDFIIYMYTTMAIYLVD